jgi:CDP-diacylglycerol--serine O-phosphatidyltransferase
MPEEEVRESASERRAERRRERRRRRRQRQRDGEPPRGLYLLPSLVTTANLGLGFFAIVQSFAGRHDLAALGIVLAAVADSIDGWVARRAKATSRFGMEYDSIADTVSFGVAPAMLAFAAGNLQVLGKPGWVMAFVFTVCAALRLARFNVSPGRYKGRFEGMPSPAAAGAIASTQWFVTFLRENVMAVHVPELVVALGVVALGLLMVSPIPYRSNKQLDLRHSWQTLVLVVIALLLIVLEHQVTLFVIAITYVLSGPAEWAWRRRTGSSLEELEPETRAGQSSA